VGAPDIGAYEFGGSDWIPGYTAVPQTTPTNTPPVGSITAPANNASVAQGTAITITATASDANGSVARVEFFDGTTKLGEDTSSPYSFAWNNAAPGTHSLTVRVTDNENATATSTAVTITVTGGSSPTVSITAPANNAQVTAGNTVSITATAADANGTITKVEFFDGTTKLGEDLSSPYTFAWNNAAAGAHVITARATDNQNNVTTSAAVNITVVAAVNTPPTVSITAPSNGAQLTSGTAITISATAADANGSVTKVEFFRGTTKLGEDLTSPYTFAWNNAAVGAHVLTARATDNQNGTTTSAAINITVVSANVAPTVSITGPTNNSQFSEGGTISITATASDANGSVTKVEFFNGTTKLGEDLTNAYSFTWTNVPAGVYIITAKATDNQNNVTTSSAITIVVGNVNVPPTVSITEPLDNSEFTIGSSVSIEANAEDTDGSVTKVEFFNGTTKLGEDLTAPYTFIWNNVVEGIYSLTAVATDNENGTTTSEAITIAVVEEPGNPVAGSPESLYSTIPRFFSPNDDGAGDYWEWTQPELFTNSLLTVFNRSGQKIFETLSYNNTWDGKLDGQPLQQGDYYYVIRMPDLTELRGSVRIIR
jgi:gliding motility-associated-like protein